MDKYTDKFIGLLALTSIFLGGSSLPIEARGLPVKEGILNFGKVNEKLFRGAQPDAAGVASLNQLGVKMIINLRMPDDVWKGEEAEAISHGIVYTNVPMRGMGRPSDDQIATLLGLIETVPGPVFIHCQHGCDRTGTIIACYRIKHDRWSREKALAEAVYYGMSRFERGMKKFVADFGNAATQLVKK